jgi:hypothetical protein
VTIRPGRRLLIDVNGNQRQILSMVEDDHPNRLGDIYIRMMPADHLHIGHPLNPAKEIESRKITIHKSRPGQTDNKISMTMVFADKSEDPDPDKESQLTDAISNGKFAPVFLRAYPNLLNIRYDVELDEAKISIPIDEYDPANFTLVAGVFAGPNMQGKLKTTTSGNYNIRYFDFSLLSLILMWCYVGYMPSQDTGLPIMDFPTDRPERIDALRQKAQAAMTQGYDERECKAFFEQMREVIRLELCRFWPNASVARRESRFYRHGMKPKRP